MAKYFGNYRNCLAIFLLLFIISLSFSECNARPKRMQAKDEIANDDAFQPNPPGKESFEENFPGFPKHRIRILDSQSNLNRNPIGSFFDHHSNDDQRRCNPVHGCNPFRDRPPKSYRKFLKNLLKPRQNLRNLEAPPPYPIFEEVTIIRRIPIMFSKLLLIAQIDPKKLRKNVLKDDNEIQYPSPQSPAIENEAGSPPPNGEGYDPSDEETIQPAASSFSKEEIIPKQTYAFKPETGEREEPVEKAPKGGEPPQPQQPEQDKSKSQEDGAEKPKENLEKPQEEKKNLSDQESSSKVVYEEGEKENAID